MGNDINGCSKIGYLILDGTQPSNYIQRSEKPIFLDNDCVFATGYLKGSSPLLILEKSIKCQQYQDCDVAVKVASTLGQIEATRWMQEIEAIKRLGYNEYIVSMLGWCIYKNSYCLAFEMATSDLLTYVRSLSVKDKSEIDLKHFVAYLWQICNAMSFIAACRMVHRDLAARNILLFGENKAKISDFGLCCDFDRDTLTYQASLTKRLPLKWLSIEALLERRFSEKSDIWSFGVLMYEMFSLGKEPYVSLQNNEIISFLSQGNRMEHFDDVPEEINEIMSSCWERELGERPNFDNLIIRFRSILETSTETYGYIK
uniref:receptor protein-tyrosine kinase n=1 Tax=Acrobeloides nanus TaxID=290746 RepID=A0A914CF54_9BILA